MLEQLMVTLQMSFISVQQTGNTVNSLMQLSQQLDVENFG